MGSKQIRDINCDTGRVYVHWVYTEWLTATDRPMWWKRYEGVMIKREENLQLEGCDRVMKCVARSGSQIILRDSAQELTGSGNKAGKRGRRGQKVKEGRQEGQREQRKKRKGRTTNRDNPKQTEHQNKKKKSPHLTHEMNCVYECIRCYSIQELYYLWLTLSIAFLFSFSPFFFVFSLLSLRWQSSLPSLSRFHS